ncbi:MAG: hypothetical protein B6247_28535, partial [Candidatus Parabeggiatoa sp. nov. 2]
APSTAGDIANQATVSSATAESDTSNNSVSEVTTVEAVAASEQADLSLSLAESADPVNTGAALSYTLTVSNAGPQTANNMQVVDTLPSGVSFVSANGTDWSCNEAGGTVICELASLIRLVWQLVMLIRLLSMSWRRVRPAISLIKRW